MATIADRRVAPPDEAARRRRVDADRAVGILGGVCGVATLVLWLLASENLHAHDVPPPLGSARLEYAAWTSQHAHLATATLVLEVVATITFVVFLGILLARLGRHWLAASAAVFGAVAATLTLAAASLTYVLLERSETTPAATQALLLDTAMQLRLLTTAAVIALAVAAAGATTASRELPAKLGWIGLVGLVALVVFGLVARLAAGVWDGMGQAELAAWLWLAAVSVVLMMRRPDIREESR